MKITRNQNGAIRIDGQSIRMYELSGWLIAYNNANGTKYNFRSVPDHLLQRFVDGGQKDNYIHGQSQR